MNCSIVRTKRGFFVNITLSDRNIEAEALQQERDEAARWFENHYADEDGQPMGLPLVGMLNYVHGWGLAQVAQLTKEHEPSYREARLTRKWEAAEAALAEARQALTDLEEDLKDERNDNSQNEQYIEKLKARVTDLEAQLAVRQYGKEAVIAEAEMLRSALAQARQALEACAKHLEDCCRSDIGWRLQMASHDKACRALADIEEDFAGHDDLPGGRFE